MNSGVLDASALLALLQHEPGEALVADTVAAGAYISTVNVSEVVAKLAADGLAEPTIRAWISALELRMVDFDADLAFRAGLLRPSTRRLGLSLDDRACLALASRLGLPAVTADRTWQQLQIGIAVEMIR